MDKIVFQKPLIISHASERKALCDEIYDYFGKQLNYVRLLKAIESRGVKSCREYFEESKKAEVKSKVALFLSMIKKHKTVWE